MKQPFTKPQSSSQAHKKEPISNDGPAVLVINASQEMAVCLTEQLAITLPGITVLYAPTLAVAKLMLKRRRFELVISNSTLPDGRVSDLEGILKHSASPPELFIMGERALHTTIHRLSEMGYALTAKVSLPDTNQGDPSQGEPLSQLGADIRHELNNPLQEIIAMAFVAQKSGSLSEGGLKALDAIERAAKQMAAVVVALEDRIRGVVGEA